MKRLFLVLTLLLSASLLAQAPTAVPLKEEPHHHLVLENEYVRVFRVSVPAHAATLLHQHDVPYLYISLGPADVVNAIQGRPEARIVMADGQVGYSPGHFAHIARTDAGSTFDNVTIELLKPQGKPHNICREVVAGPVSDACSGPPMMRIPELKDKFVPLFETDHIFVKQLYVREKPDHMDVSGDRNTALLVALASADFELQLSDQPSVRVAAGGVAWVPSGQKFSVSAPNGIPVRFLKITFRDGAPFAKP